MAAQAAALSAYAQLLKERAGAPKAVECPEDHPNPLGEEPETVKPATEGEPKVGGKDDAVKEEKVKKERSRSRGRKRRRSRSRSRRRRRRRRRSPSNSGSGDDDGVDYGPGLRKRRRGEKRHRNMWDVQPDEAEKLGLLKGLPINIGSSGDFMHADRAGRRVYVGNLPLNVKEAELRDFFNAVMVAAQGPSRKPGNSVLGVFLNLPKRFAFVEFRNAIDATQAMDLDGIMFRGLALKLGRPANYNASASCIAARQAPKLNLSKLGIFSSHVPNGPNKLYIGGLPYNLKQNQVRELLEAYGPLRGLFLSYDPATNLSKGYAFAYYEDESVTDAAIEGLGGLQIGDRTLAIRRHESCANFMNTNQMMDDIVKKDVRKVATMTNTLCLMQMVTLDDLKDPEELSDIKNDIATECSNYGTVLDIEIPGLSPTGKPLPVAKKVFVQFQSEEEATKCKTALQGRCFADRTVVVSYYEPERFIKRDFL